MEKTCKFCKLSFEITRNKRLNAFYCSRECYNFDHYCITLCKTCNIEFAHHKTKKRIFCSIRCSNSFHNPTKVKKCQQCQKDFAGLKWKRENIFCSKNCLDKSNHASKQKIRDKNPNFIDGKYTYRAHAFRELPNQCFNCESIENLEVHHIDKDRENGKLSNLIILCRSCHRKYHHGTLPLDS